MKVFVKPKPGIKVPDISKGGKFLPPEGSEVSWSSYWDRLLIDDSIDVIETKELEKIVTVPEGNKK